MILLNTILAAFLEFRFQVLANTANTFLKLIIFALISLPFIWKLWTFYCHKMRQFIIKNYEKSKPDNDIKEKEKLVNFFEFSMECNCIGVFIGFIVAAAYICMTPSLDVNSKIIIPIFFLITGYFLPVFLGFFSFTCRHLSGRESKPKKIPVGACCYDKCRKTLILLSVIF